MDTMNTTQSTAGQGSQGRSFGGESSPLGDLAYDVLTVLQKKCKALEAYDKYLRDAQSNEKIHGIFQELREQDIRDVERLRECLQHVLSQGGEMQSNTVGG